MLVTIEELSGIKNVGDSLRAAKVTFDSDGNALLSGDLKASVNFRIGLDRIGQVRNGQTLKYTGTALNRLWTNRAGNIGLVTDGTALKLLNSDYTVTSLYNSLTTGRRMNFEEHNNIVFMGNGAQMLKYKDGAVSTWGDVSAIAEEFEYPSRTYRTPPLSNILKSYRSRMYVADGRFTLFSEPNDPERFRRANNIPSWEEVTAYSVDLGHLYIHTLNTTKVLSGLDPEDFIEAEYGIGAVKHGSITPLAVPYILTKQGWAVCHDGIVEYVDHDNFRLDLADTAEAYLGYDPVNKEIIGRVKV